MPVSIARTTIPLGDLGCGGGAVGSIERALARVPGVFRVYANPLTEMAYVEFDPALCTPADLTAAVQRAGRAVHGATSSAPGEGLRPPRGFTSNRSIPMRSDQLRLDATSFGFAAAIVAAALFTLCALAVALAPEWTTLAASSLIHLDLSNLARTLTWGGFFVGLICWSVGTWLVFASVAGLYNRLQSRRVPVARDVAAHGIA